MKKFKQIGALSILLFILTACSSLIDTRSFVHPEADFSFYQRVGVIPFKNQSGDELAGDKVTEHFLTELLINSQLEVMDPGQFNAVIAQVAKTRAPVSTLKLSPSQLEQIAEVAGVQGIFTGTIHDYDMISFSGERYPMISMTLKFIDAPTGTIAWQNSATITGGPNLPIVSIGETFTLGKLTQKVCRVLVKDFHKKAFSK